MLEFFSSPLMLKAFVAIIVIAFILPMLGINVVTKKISMIGDTLAHTSLCGVALGLVSSIYPIFMAIIISGVCGIIIELIRNKFNKYSEISLAIVLSLAIAITGILTKYAPGSYFESFLFGSLLTITYTDIYILLALLIIVSFYFFMTYRINLSITYSEKEAKVSGINVNLFNLINMFIISISVAICASIIGTLLVSSLLVIPTACALKLFKKYSLINIFSIVISLCMQITGFLLAYIFDINTGGTIVLVGVIFLLLILLIKYLIEKFKIKKNKMTLK